MMNMRMRFSNLFGATAAIHRAAFDLTHAIWSGMVGDEGALLIEMEGELQ